MDLSIESRQLHWSENGIHWLRLTLLLTRLRTSADGKVAGALAVLQTSSGISFLVRHLDTAGHKCRRLDMTPSVVRGFSWRITLISLMFYHPLHSFANAPRLFPAEVHTVASHSITDPVRPLHYIVNLGDSGLTCKRQTETQLMNCSIPLQ